MDCIILIPSAHGQSRCKYRGASSNHRGCCALLELTPFPEPQFPFSYFVRSSNFTSVLPSAGIFSVSTVTLKSLNRAGMVSGPSTVAGAAEPSCTGLRATPCCLLTVTLYSPSGTPRTNPDVSKLPIANLPSASVSPEPPRPGVEPVGWKATNAPGSGLPFMVTTPLTGTRFGPSASLLQPLAKNVNNASKK